MNSITLKKAGAVIFFRLKKRSYGLLAVLLTVFFFISNAVHSQCIIYGTNPSCAGKNNGSIYVLTEDQKASDKKVEFYKKGVLDTTVSNLFEYTLNNLSPDSFSVKIYSFDSSNWILFCSKEIVLTDPTPIVLSGVKGDVNCKGVNNGIIDLTVTGGTLPYSFAWSNDSTTEDLSNLAPENYFVFVSDIKNCTANKNFDITEPAMSIGLSLKAINSDCTGKTGSIDATVAGGTSPYKYKWSPNGEVTEDITALGPGKYVLIVSDNHGCSVADSSTLSAPANALKLNTAVTPVTCNGNNDGTASVIISNGRAPYIISWTGSSSSDTVASGLAPGTYTVSVMDSSNCSASADALITEPTALSLKKVDTNIYCKGDATGAINITPSGGTAPYLYSWSNGAQTQNITALKPGAYALDLMDSKNCKTSTSSVLSEPDSVLTGSITGSDLNCKGANSGSEVLTVSGGTKPYSFDWSNGATTKDLQALAAGHYYVTITDTNGCSIDRSIKIIEPAVLLLITPDVTNIGCAGETNGAISIGVVGGLAPYSFVWSSSGDTSRNLSGLSHGTYTVIVTDGNNCHMTKAVKVSEPLPITASFDASIGCTGQDGTIDLSVTGGTEPYSYNWSNGKISEDMKDLLPGVYKVSITDFRYCTHVDSVTIKEEPHKCINVPNGFTPNADGINDTWILRNIGSFPKSVIDVFNSEGNLVFNSTGYAVPWDGSSNGVQVLTGTYYYVINLNSGDKQLSGTVTVLR